MRLTAYVLIIILCTHVIVYLKGHNDGFDGGHLVGVFECQFDGLTVEDLVSDK